jgi:hypothetical protein
MTLLEPAPTATLTATEVRLPEPRGPLTAELLDHLRRPVHDLGDLADAGDDPLTGEDAPLALYLCYELHYRGLPGVDDDWEWEPSLLRLHHRLEVSFEARLTDLAGPVPVGLDRDGVVQALCGLATTDGGPSLSGYVAAEATDEQVRELAVHRSAYQLKEADPHTWAIPRLVGDAKARMVEIQMGEYGHGAPADVHATMFADTMAALGLDPAYGAHLDLVPGATLSTCNLISFFGLHRRWRGALVGHLALFEMCSVGPMGRYAAAMRRLGYGDDAARFYDIHVEADQLHQHIALDMAGDLVDDEPELGGDIVFGARALAAVEAPMAGRILDAWHTGHTSLLRPVGLA